MTASAILPELPWMWAGVALYGSATALALAGVVRQHPQEKRTLGLMLLAAALLAAGVGVRWARIGHGPFFTMFEALVSNLVSLGMIFALAYWRLPVLRASAVVVLPLLLVMGLWLVVANPVDSHFPATYATNWLWIHLAMGKLFLGSCLIAAGLGGVILLRRNAVFTRWFGGMPPDTALDYLAWRFMSLALVFVSLMLIAGAVWAQEAWGRYRDWDPLETWAFLTWLALAAFLHVRVTYRTPPWVGALMILGVFILAFLTFFGVPFISLAPHKGMV